MANSVRGTKPSLQNRVDPPAQRRVDEKKLYSVAAAAEALSITRKHLYTLIGRGEIATVTIGRRRLNSSVELDQFVEHLVLLTG
jgi:excisionase family DNA binding protein